MLKIFKAVERKKKDKAEKSEDLYIFQLMELESFGTHNKTTSI